MRKTANHNNKPATKSQMKAKNNAMSPVIKTRRAAITIRRKTVAKKEGL